jgi:DivIVA domain-containing protein
MRSEATPWDHLLMELTAEQVRNIAFSKPPIGKRGYNEEEVDAFLDLVEEQLSSQPAETARNEGSAASEPPSRWELFPIPSVWKRRPPLAIDIEKDVIRVVDTKTNALVTLAPLPR